MSLPSCRIALAAALAVALIVPVSAHATPFAVNSTADEVDSSTADNVCLTGSGTCTLRAAIQQANAHTGDDTITLGTGDFTLTLGGAGEADAATGDLDLRADDPETITITGAGARATRVIGVAGDRVFEIGDSVVTANFSNLTVTGGNGIDQGGGFFNLGTLNLTDVTVSGNTVEAPSGSSNQGGGIFNNRRMNLRNVTVSGNSAKRGASSTFGPQGGGIFDNGSPTSTMTNVTIENNQLVGTGSQGAGLFYNADALSTTITNSTITGNISPSSGEGAGIFVNDDITVVNTIVTLNRGNGAPDGCAVADPTEMHSVGHNIEEGVDCKFAGPADQHNADAVLGPLQDNGGPTDTRALLSGSPAIDAGDSGPCPSADQRGIARPQGAGCDIGAFEVGGPAPPGAGPAPQPQPQPTAKRVLPKAGCLSIPNVTRDRLAPFRGGKIVLATRQSDDPVNPLRLSVKLRGRGSIASVTFTVNGKAVGRGTVPHTALRIGSRRNKVVATVKLRDGRKVKVTQFLVILRCHVPALACKRLAGGRSLSCRTSTPLGVRRVRVVATGPNGETATGSAKVKQGKYTVTLRSRVPLSAGVYVYKHVGTTKHRGERFFMVRLFSVA